jgi:hypothetical protein
MVRESPIELFGLYVSELYEENTIISIFLAKALPQDTFLANCILNPQV